MKYLPQPYFLLDREFNILGFSQISSEIILIVDKFPDLVDWESQGKMKTILGLKVFPAHSLS
ncbi:hypothetical protein G3A_03840 [Bacillus sp. 17376]|uniref:hypothetical protein n=1 Tax=Mesobacillus boroniphilus TaxID=308892 RepID=UPI0003C78F4F|nr:hypothetical protein [Mesobacillus boroniphilus]ESU33937.1 hypothetical protein G3A_03840 [Bacillus sp. 17376]